MRKRKGKKNSNEITKSGETIAADESGELGLKRGLGNEVVKRGSKERTKKESEKTLETKDNCLSSSVFVQVCSKLLKPLMLL